MKFFIWLGCLGGAAILMTIIQRGMGVTLGPFIKTLIVIIASTIATRLCKSYNNANNEETLETDDATNDDEYWNKNDDEEIDENV